MEKRTLGRTGLEVTALGLGCMGFSHAYGTFCLEVLHLHGERPAVTIRVLPAYGGLAVVIGNAGSAGDGELPGLVGLAPAEIVVFVGHVDGHIRHGGFILHKLDGDGGLIPIVQQTAVGEPDGKAVVCVQRYQRPGNGIFRVRVGDDNKEAAHNGLSVGIGGSLIVDFFDRFRFQLLAAVLALFMTAALGAGGGFLVHDPLAGGVAGGLGVSCFALSPIRRIDKESKKQNG